jgi:hypothetical protein
VNVVYIKNQNYHVHLCVVEFPSQNTPHLSANGIVDDVISKLNDMILLNDLQSEDSSYRSQTVCEDTSVTVTGTTGELDICADEQVEVNKNYSTLSRDEKLNRLFIVLEIIVELLEIDLCVFLVKHSSQLREALVHRSCRPLIVSVLWRTSMLKKIGHPNGVCRRIIALYTKCFVHNMNFNRWNALAVSIIGHQQLASLWYSRSQHSLLRHNAEYTDSPEDSGIHPKLRHSSYCTEIGVLTKTSHDCLCVPFNNPHTM